MEDEPKVVHLTKRLFEIMQSEVEVHKALGDEWLDDLLVLINTAITVGETRQSGLMLKRIKDMK